MRVDCRIFIFRNFRVFSILSFFPCGLFRREKGFINDSNSPCNISQPISWNRGVITSIAPAIKKNCSKLFQGDVEEISFVQRQLKYWKQSVSDEQLVIQLKNCSFVRNEFLHSYYVSSKEETFPIAYILLVHMSPQQIVRFLKAVYRPHNIYCVHPDPKSGVEFSLYFHLLSKCLGNVFVASKLTNVAYGASSASTFDAQLNCYRDLLNISAQWHYVINLCGRDLPLRTNREIVEHLISLNGSSFINPNRLNKDDLIHRFYSKLEKEARTPPHGIELYKSSSYNALSREFVTFFIRNQTAIDFYHWIHKTGIPEEHFYASMYMYYMHHFYSHVQRMQRSIVRAKWVFNNQNGLCAGRIVHYICIISCSDLHQVQYSIKNTVAFFYNKYFMEEDHVVMDCVEEKLIERNRIEYNGDCM